MKMYHLMSFVFMFNKADLIPALQSFPIISPLWCICNILLQPCCTPNKNLENYWLDI